MTKRLGYVAHHSNKLRKQTLAIVNTGIRGPVFDLHLLANELFITLHKHKYNGEISVGGLPYIPTVEYRGTLV